MQKVLCLEMDHKNLCPKQLTLNNSHHQNPIKLSLSLLLVYEFLQKKNKFFPFQTNGNFI